ncbi:glycosyltransferase [Candidatus Pelagibacter ubique]|nr:glycosyltransferase [Candidatus Pelagibacter ubique]
MKTKNLSVSFIFPVYNEEKRLKFLFKKITKYEKKNNGNEFIFVNDGSNDKSLAYISDFIKDKNKKYKLISYKKNMGKGYALKMGVKEAKKDWLLTLDTDLSVKLIQINNWFKIYKLKYNNVYFGSRNHPKSILEAKLHRKVIGNVLNIILKIVFKKNVSQIKDTQCGFKLYPKKIGKKIFKNIFTLNFAHDIEILMKLSKQRIKVIELPVEWKHCSESKVNIITDSFKIIFSIFKIKNKL